MCQPEQSLATKLNFYFSRLLLFALTTTTLNYNDTTIIAILLVAGSSRSGLGESKLGRLSQSGRSTATKL